MPDHCKDTVCANGGLCVDGMCSCLNGYEGDDCSEIWNGRFLDEWTALDKVQGRADTSLPYSLSLIANGRPDQFLVLGLRGNIDSVLCRRQSYFGFTILENQVIDSVSTIRSGSGVLDTSGALIAASYTIAWGDSLQTYQVSWARQTP